MKLFTLAACGRTFAVRSLLAGLVLALLPLLVLGQAPTLTSVTPLMGVPGSILALTGTNLTGTTTIRFTGAAGTKTVTTGFMVASATSITGVVVPAGAQSGPITITTGSGTSAAGSVFFSRARTLATGRNHSVAIQADGSLWAWGLNDNGQLGQGNTNRNYTMPVQVGSVRTWVSAAAGNNHTVAVQADGSLWAWGSRGQVGDGTTTDRLRPVQVGTATNWVSAAAGRYHTVAVRADGTLWAWGFNGDGELGQGNTNSNYTMPVQVGTASNWVSAAGGYGHTVGVQADGSLWAWGYNIFGQVGNGGLTQPLSPVRVGTANNWVNVAAGNIHTVAVQADGSLWAWGQNGSGQLGNNSRTDSAVPVRVGTGSNWMSAAGGIFHTAAVQADGSLWAWGSNSSGELGQGNTNGGYISPTQVGAGSNWVSATAGSSHTAGEQSCRAVWTWGSSAEGQLGDGTINNSRSNPMQIYAGGAGLLTFTPASAATGTTVTATGSGLTNIASLSVNGAPVALANIRNNTDGSFSFVVPAGATATGTTTVAASCGTANSTGFTVLMSMGTATSPGLDEQVQLYPNPAHSSFTLLLPEGKVATAATLVNSLGQVVRTLSGAISTVEVRGLAPGLYQVRVQAGGQQWSQRLVVE